MQKNKSGFTIVELITVIAVLSILAAILLVAYRGIQDRAKNSQTVAAANQWVKALEIYKARNGSLPAMSSCLGSDYKYNADGLGSSGVGQCRQDNSSSGLTSQSSFDSAVAPYITGTPTPAMVTARNTATSWYRGLYYYVDSTNNARIDMVMTPSGDNCPTQLGDIALSSSTLTSSGNYLCTYPLGSTTSY